MESKEKNCISCRITGGITFLMVAIYFFKGCKHIKPVYYIGTPSMFYLAIARSLNLPPFKY